MDWLVSLFVAFLSGVIGLLIAGFIANACVAWFHISSREGASGFFIIYIALLGGLVGFFLGLLTASVISWIHSPSFLNEVFGALSVVFAFAGIVALLCFSFADIPPKLDGFELKLEVEFRFPITSNATPLPTLEGEWMFVFSSLSGLRSRKQIEGTIESDRARYENGQWIVPTQVDLFTGRGKRCVSLSHRNSKEVMSFLLPLPARPRHIYENWSEWLPRQQSDRSAWPSDKMSCRFRIRKIHPEGDGREVFSR